jgi:tetratricopeptide (TPR) repeat protein
MDEDTIRSDADDSAREGERDPSDSRAPAAGDGPVCDEQPAVADRLADHSGEAYELYRRGHAFLKGNHPGQAAVFFERARRLAPGKNSIREALGRAYFHLGRYDHAAAEFAAILDHVPTNDYARYALGRSFLKLDRLAEARAQLRLAVAMSPGNQWYRAALERCLAEEERAREADR